MFAQTDLLSLLIDGFNIGQKTRNYYDDQNGKYCTLVNFQPFDPYFFFENVLVFIVDLNNIMKIVSKVYCPIFPFSPWLKQNE